MQLNGPRGTSIYFRVEKGCHLAIKMHPKLDIQKRSAPGRVPPFGAVISGRLSSLPYVEKKWMLGTVGGPKSFKIYEHTIH